MRCRECQRCVLQASVILATEFTDSFVRSYWAEVVSDPPEFADHSDPCTETLEKLLADVTVEWHQNAPEHLEIVMQNRSGDAWRFTFVNSANKWTIHSATSGSPPSIDTVNMLDEVYSEYFRPFLEHIITAAQMER